MPAAIDVQQHTWQRAPRSAVAMHPALPPALYQPGSLQGQFHPGVAQCNLVLGAQLLMKMSHVQIEILLPVESQNLFHQRHGDSLGRRLPPPSIEQPVIAELFVALPPTTHVPLANADDLGRLPPRDPFRHGPQNHFLYFHCPLHRGLRVRNHASHGLLPSPPEKRTYHVLSQPDISCANDSPQSLSLTCIHASDSLRRALGLGLGASGKIPPPILPGNLITSGTRKQQTSLRDPGGSIHEKNCKLSVGNCASVCRDGRRSCPGNDATAKSIGHRSRIYEAG